MVGHSSVSNTTQRESKGREKVGEDKQNMRRISGIRTNLCQKEKKTSCGGGWMSKEGRGTRGRESIERRQLSPVKRMSLEAGRGRPKKRSRVKRRGGGEVGKKFSAIIT